MITEAEKKVIIELIERHWRFDTYQQPLSSWHEKEECLAKLRAMNAGEMPKDLNKIESFRRL